MAGMRGDRWDEPGESVSGGRWDRRFVDEVDGGVTLVPQSAGQWAIALVMLVFLVGGVGGVYWNSVSRQASADEAASVAMAELKATSQSAASGQSSGGALPGETPMSGRYPIGPDGKLLRPLDVRLPDPPSKPENMAFGTQEGAEAFNHYLTDLIEYTTLTGDTSKLKEISHPDCVWCQDYSAAVEKRLDNQGWVVGLSLTLTGATVPEYLPAPKDLWHSVATIENSESYSYDGETIRKRESIVQKLLVVCRYSEGKWILVEAGRSEE